MDPAFEQGVALVTGCASGIGRQMALEFARQGCRKIFLADLSMSGMEETKAAILDIAADAGVSIQLVDICDENSVKSMVDQCISDFARLDFCCNNAGAPTKPIPTHEMDLKTFKRVNLVNGKGTYLCQTYEIAAMLKQDPLDVPGAKHLFRGSIVNTASMAGISAIAGLTAYGASKHSVVSMTRVDARQYAPKGIRINNVCPGYCATSMLLGDMPESWHAGSAREAPMNRLVDPGEVANAAVFLSGSKASAITGISMPVDGGALLYHII